MTDNTEIEGVPEGYDYTEEFKYVLGMDPGGTTGIAMLRYTDNTPPELIYLHQIEDGRVGFFEWFNGSTAESLEAGAVTAVSEKWKTREGIHSADLEPVYIEGVQYALWQDAPVYQTPDMKSLISDDFLKEQNLWTPGKRHQMDALIHALVYLRNEGHKPTLESLSGKAEETLEQEGGAKDKQLDPEAMKEAQEAADALAEAMKEIAEAAAEAQAEIDALTEAMEGDGTGDGEAGDQPGHADGDSDKLTTEDPQPQDESPAQNGQFTGLEIPDTPEVEGTRRRRTRGGAFMGFAIDEDEE